PGDHRHPVDPGGQEGLEVGLDAGAAARVGPGDGKRPGDHSTGTVGQWRASSAKRRSRVAAPSHGTRPLRAARTARARSCTARLTSGARSTADATATPQAPAAMTAAALAALMPPIPTTGTGRARATAPTPS